MALILAIEPDRRQVSKLTMLARNYLHTEIVVTDSIGRALVMLDERLPDLILTSFQLQPKHRAALMDRLVEVDADGTRVQTLVIPALGAPGCRPSLEGRGWQQTQQKGMAALPHGMHGNHAVADGCDPLLFGKQIAECLGRIAPERQSAPHEEWTRAVSPKIPEPESSEAETPEGSGIRASMPIAASHGWLRPEGLSAASNQAPASPLNNPDWRDLLSTIRDDLNQMRAEHTEPSEDTEASEDTEPSEDTERSEDTRPTETHIPSPKVKLPRRIRRQTARSPEQEEWAYIKRGFAMLAKANKVVEEGRAPAKKSV